MKTKILFTLPLLASLAQADVLIDEKVNKGKSLFIDEKGQAPTVKKAPNKKQVNKPVIVARAATTQEISSKTTKKPIAPVNIKRPSASIVIERVPMHAPPKVVEQAQKNLIVAKMEKKASPVIKAIPYTELNKTEEVKNTKLKEDKNKAVDSDDALTHNLSQKVKLIPIEADFSEYGVSKEQYTQLVRPKEFNDKTHKDLVKKAQERKVAEKEKEKGLDDVIDSFFKE